jgi:hypothetical protein
MKLRSFIGVKPIHYKYRYLIENVRKFADWKYCCKRLGTVMPSLGTMLIPLGTMPIPLETLIHSRVQLGV